MSAVRHSEDAAGLMDRMYRFQRHIYDATRKFYLLGRDGLVDGLQPPMDGSVLEIGCGTGRNLIRIARAYPHARCYGLDVSEEMLATARQQVAKAGLSGRITLKQADATSFDPQTLFGRADFDRVVVSYALSMIPPWRAVLARALSRLAPGGSLHIVDFGDQAHLPAPFKALLNRWLALFHVTPRPELAAELEQLCTESGASGSTRRLYGGYAVQGLATRRG